MAGTSTGGGTAHPATVRAASHASSEEARSHRVLVIAAQRDLVARCQRQLANAEAELARLLKEN